LLAIQLAADLGVAIHASTIRRLLPKLGIGWNRARPTLCIADPQKSRKLRAIRRALAALRRAYRQAQRILLIVDNYSIHKSRIAHSFLAHNPKFQLLFQPVYHPWVNVIERLWKQLHDNVTRNHRCTTMPQLMHNVRHFMNHIAPFTKTHYAVLKA
jgi:transposase